MADIASIFAASLNHINEKDVMDQVFNKYPLYAMMGAGTPVAGGVKIQQPIGIGKNTTVAARDYREDIPIGEQNPLETAYWDWKFLNGSVSWYEAQEKMNAGPDQIVPFVKTLQDILFESMTEGLALEQWEDGTGKHFDGIQAIVDTDNTYGGLDRSDDTYRPWRAWIGDRSGETGYDSSYKFSTTESLVVRGGTDGGIEHLCYRCGGNGGADMPNYGACTLALYEKIKASYDPKLLATNQKIADLGFPVNFMIGGLTVFYDENAPSGTFTVLNTKHIQMKPHTSNAKRFNVTPAADRHSVGGMSKVVLIEYMGNMICTRPNRCGALTNKS